MEAVTNIIPSYSPINPQINKLKTIIKKPIFIVMALIVILLLVGSGVYAFMVQHQNTSVTKDTPTPTTSITPTQLVQVTTTNTPTITPTAIPGGKLFISQDLGIAFSYEPTFLNGTVSAVVNGSKVSLSSNNPNNQLDEYIQVFTKNNSDSIDQAISKIILNDYSTSDCNISSNITTTPIPASYELRTITGSASKCPASYLDTSNGTALFIMDSNHTGKFVFVHGTDLGLTASSQSNEGWFNSLVFF